MDFMLNITFYAFIFGVIAYVIREVSRSVATRYIALGVMSGALILNTTLVLMRWFEAGHAPMSDKFESFVFFAWSIALVYIIMELVTIFIVRIHSSRLGIIGALQCALSALFLYFAINTDSTIKELPPALQSNWLVTHVINYFISYAALSISFSAAIIYLIYRAIFHGKTQEVVMSKDNSNLGKDMTFDKLAYISVSIGFPFLTIGLITGSIWAKGAWGTYWGWDPKEIWSLINWLIYLTYLHLPLILPKTKISKSFRPVLLSIILLVAFPTVIFTFMGLHKLPTAGTSDHIYAD
ncbi:MAG: c-type cytochrome biogenesis protein CcsB [Candidatus Scalindua sp. AMX11]|nr:MAG: c-type cytochrome biogenesis protein CcsB [Candidatus Scalindua sp.]NOG83207.1 c-type cytochrome biogenesis protein CcsB [Planctomycetota bacterium]RZV77572.1 MAG: c-type cytochrome biogenesis protein CcsB [Candidatus Scalindua sp. SCAELEC01]TDE64549.1 MAG: c-type cytochrome biogenesis protein CcsB [Candidatus Scalindua sp. AMX11]GJQ58639.1 MAG: c-type cytochrome biogenesis protein CcsB [Candidatus Scalindua sp.]